VSLAAGEQVSFALLEEACSTSTLTGEAITAFATGVEAASLSRLALLQARGLVEEKVRAGDGVDDFVLMMTVMTMIMMMMMMMIMMMMIMMMMRW